MKSMRTVPVDLGKCNGLDFFVLVSKGDSRSTRCARIGNSHAIKRQLGINSAPVICFLALNDHASNFNRSNNAISISCYFNRLISVANLLVCPALITCGCQVCTLCLRISGTDIGDADTIPRVLQLRCEYRDCDSHQHGRPMMGTAKSVISSSLKKPDGTRSANLAHP